ncbi:unnamed protein product [Ceutorhynchus assimilis]|uniref:Uncharacterized protein n=1 Tax=Ceutorhynchus assimilis TaxID=467358 RepID=A0A9N9QP79_9CUCU|nr:unnamed protein product [Ceutorhynchus assimilis]
MDETRPTSEIPSPKNLNVHHWTSEEKIFKRKEKILRKIEPLSIPLRSALLYRLSRSFLGSFLKELNPNDIQDFLNNDNKWQILNWELRRYSKQDVKIINTRNCFIDDCYGLVEKAVTNGVEINLKFLESKIRNLRLDCIFVKKIDDCLKKFEHLKFLSLCGNYIRDIPGKFLPRNLEFLELFDNFIDNLSTFVKKAPKSLRHLGIGRNRLNDDSQLHLLGESRNFSQLISMDLSDNEFCNLELTLKSLGSVESLKSLCLEGNPCAVVSNYKTDVLECMPSLLYLDATEILDNDRISSENTQTHPHVVFHCFRILGLPEPPRDKKSVQTIHIEVNFPLLRMDSEGPNNDSAEEINFEEKEISTNEKNSQESLLTNKKKTSTIKNKTKSRESKSKSTQSKTKAKKSYYTIENEDINEAKHTKWYKSQRKPWSKKIEFDPIQINDDYIPLSSIRDTFRSIVPVRIIYLKFAPDSSKSKKSPNSKKTNTNYSKINEVGILSPQEEEPEEEILKKITLATFYCDLKTVNWSDKTLDFYWADHPRMGDRALRIDNGSLLDLDYNLDSTKKARKVTQGPETEPEKAALPHVLTCQIGFGWNR